MRVIECLADPDKLLQIEFDRFIAGCGSEQAPGIERANAQAIGLSQVIELIGGDHAARSRLVGDVDARFARNVTFDMPSDHARGQTVPPPAEEPTRNVIALPS